VTLLELKPELGGRARTAGLRRGRERWRLYLEWLAGELHSHGVDVRLGQAVDANDIAALDPDIVILATGSQPRRAGWHDNHDHLVADADEVIVSAPEPRGSASAIIVDQEGGFTAPTAAESLRHADWTVQIITDLPFVAAKVDPTQVWFVRRRVPRERGTDYVPHAGSEKEAAPRRADHVTTLPARSGGRRKPGNAKR
jgi:dimethylglycine catabolism A